MAATAHTKKMQVRVQHLYSKGMSAHKIAGRFLITHHVVSRLLKLTKNAGLRRQHAEHRALDRKLISGKNQTLVFQRIQEIYALGIGVEGVCVMLAVPPLDVIKAIDGDAELERQHAACVALDRELIAEKPPLPARRRDGSAYGRGKPTPNGQPKAELSLQPPRPQPKAEVQPPPAAQPKPAEAPPAQSKPQPAAPPDRPAAQPTARSASPAAPANRPQRASPTPPAPPSQRPDPENAEIAAAKRKVELVRKHVRAYEPPYRPPYEPHYGRAYEYFPAYTPEEARQVTMYIARIVTGLSYLDLAEVFDCDYSTIHSACDKVVALYAVLAPARDRIVRIEHEIREELCSPSPCGPRGSTPARAPAATEPPPRSVPEWVAAPL